MKRRLRKATPLSLKVKCGDGPSVLLPPSHCLPAVTFPATVNPHLCCCVQGTVFHFLPTWASCRMHTPYSSLNSYCCENKRVFLFSPLLTANLVGQQLFRALRKLPDSAQIKHCKIISRLQRGSVSLSQSCI